MKREYLRRSSLMGLILAALTVSHALAGEGFIRVRKASDIPKEFDPNKPLIVKGTVPPGSNPWSESQLEEYGRQLKQINSTRKQKFAVLLLEKFSDESFRLENERFDGRYKAVQAVVETGIKPNLAYNAGDFAFICISFEQSNDAPYNGTRPFEFWPSRQLIANGFSVPQIWDQWLKDRMLGYLKARNINTCFLDTASHLNDQLDQKLEADARRIAAQKEAEARALAALQTEGIANVRSAEEKLALLTAGLQNLRKQHGDRNGDVFHPDLTAVSSDLALARQALDRKDYGQAKQAGARAIGAIDPFLRNIDEYTATPAKLQELTGRLAGLKKHSHFDSARTIADAAAAKVARAQEALNLGSSTTVVERNEAQNLVAKAERTAADAKTAEIRRTAMYGTLGVVVILGALVVVVVLRKRASKIRLQFEEAFARRAEVLKAMREAHSALQHKMNAVLGKNRAESEIGSDGSDSRTKQDAEKAGTLVGDVFIMLSCADSVSEGALSLASPSDIGGKVAAAFSAGHWQAALDYLDRTPVKFNKQSGLRFALGEKQVSPAEALWKPLEQFEDFEMSFRQLKDGIARKSKEADGLLDKIQEAVQSVPKVLADLSRTLHGAGPGDQASLSGRFDAARRVWEGEGALVLNAFPDKLVPALDAEIQRLTGLGKRDPVSAMEQIDALKRKFSAASALIGDVEKVAAAFSGIVTAFGTLQSLKVRSAWVKQDYGSILNRLDSQFLAVATASDDEPLPGEKSAGEQLKIQGAQQAAALKAKVEKAAALVTALRGTLDAGIDAATKLVEDTRARIALAIGGLDPSRILVEQDEVREEDLNPDSHLAAARRFGLTCSDELGEGDVEAAEKAYERGTSSLNAARTIVESTVAAHEAYKSRTAAINTESDRLAAQVGPHKGILARIEAEFDPAVLIVKEGDKAAPEDNGTIGDNFEEIVAAEKLRREHLGSSAELYSEGRVFAATRKLAAAEAANHLIEHRLAGVARRRERLDATVAANVRTRQELFGLIGRLKDAIADARVMNPTISQFEYAGTVAHAAIKLIDQPKPNPFAIESELGKARTALQKVEERIGLDHKINEEAVSSVKAARTMYQRVVNAANKVLGDADGIGDSAALRQVPAALQRLRGRLESVEQASTRPRADWNEVDREADSVAAALQQLLGVVDSEAKAGEEASNAISSAAGKVREAANWSGSYSVSIDGRPGSSLLSQARDALARGDYSMARDYASNARSKAASAIAAAVAEVERRRREEEERQRREAERRRREEEEREEAARRRRNSYSSSSSSGSGGFGGFSSSGGSSGSSGFSSSGGSGGW